MRLHSVCTAIARITAQSMRLKGAAPKRLKSRALIDFPASEVSIAPVPSGSARQRPAEPGPQPISGNCRITVGSVEGAICSRPIPTASNGEKPRISIVGTTIQPQPTPQ